MKLADSWRRWRGRATGRWLPTGRHGAWQKRTILHAARRSFSMGQTIQDMGRLSAADADVLK